MDTKDIQLLLNANGFPCGYADGIVGPATRAAVARFQQAHAFVALAVDGIPGPQTQAALSHLPLLSPHFEVHEVMCRHCGLAYVHRELLSALEELRARVGAPITLLDAYRCEHHNAEIGGATDSQHKTGTAVDLDTRITVAAVRQSERFSGIGNRGVLASHIDVRHVLGDPATPQAPALWSY